MVRFQVLAGVWCVYVRGETGGDTDGRCILENLKTVQAGGWWLAGALWLHSTPLHYNLPSLVRAEPGSPGLG